MLLWWLEVVILFSLSESVQSLIPSLISSGTFLVVSMLLTLASSVYVSSSYATVANVAAGGTFYNLACKKYKEMLAL